MEPFSRPTFTDERYSIIDELGRGGMGIVYRCRDKKLNKDVAVKVVSWNYSDADAIRFQTEAKVLASLRHPNILSVLDFGSSEEGYLYLVMDVLKGKTLSALLDERKIRYEEALTIFIQVCDGLSHAHGKGVLHRDIKPSNVFVEHEKDKLIVTITDFGLAKLVGEDQKLTRTGVSVGSPPYMSPEQANAKTVSERSDIYSIGCLMFETLTGSPPFIADSVPEILLMHMRKPPPKLAERAPDFILPEKLQEVVDKCLAKDPLDRFRTTEDLKKELVRLTDTSTIMPDSVFSGAFALMSSANHKLREILGHAEPQQAKAGSPSGIILLVVAIGVCLVITAVIAIKLMQPDPTFEEFKTSEQTPDFAQGKVDTDIVAKGELQTVENQGDRIWVTLKNDASKKIKSLQSGTQHLDLSDSNVTDEDIKSIEHLKLLRLRLTRTSISDKALESAGKITTLEDLILTSCKNITDKGIKALGNLKQLSNLSLSGTNVSDEAIATIAQLDLRDLQSLALDQCQNVTGRNLDRLGACTGKTGTLKPRFSSLFLERSGLKKENIWRITAIPTLHTLNLSGLNLDDDDLMMLSSTPDTWILAQLEIRNNPAIKDTGFLSLCRLQTLTILDIRNCNGISRSACNELRTHIPLCKLITR